MPRFWIVACVTVLLLIALAAISWRSSVASNSPAYVLHDEDVESITAEVYGIDFYALGEVPQTKIPSECIPKILDALRPIYILKERSLWDKLPSLGKMTIHKRDGMQIQIALHLCGQNRLAYEYNGVLCYRGGPYEPMVDILDNDGTRLGYGDESLALARAIEGIHDELVTGMKCEQVAESFDALECSHGKRPPK